MYVIPVYTGARVVVCQCISDCTCDSVLVFYQQEISEWLRSVEYKQAIVSNEAISGSVGDKSTA